MVLRCEQSKKTQQQKLLFAIYPLSILYFGNKNKYELKHSLKNSCTDSQVYWAEGASQSLTKQSDYIRARWLQWMQIKKNIIALNS